MPRLGGELGHCAAAAREDRQSVVEAAGTLVRGRVAVRRIVAHARRAEDLRHANLVLQPLRLRLPVAVRPVEKVRADGVVRHRDPGAVAQLAQFRRERQRRLARRQLQRAELHHVEPHLPGLRRDVGELQRASRHRLAETVGTDAEFHARSLIPRSEPLETRARDLTTGRNSPSIAASVGSRSSRYRPVSDLTGLLIGVPGIP